MTKGKLILESETQRVEYDVDHCQIEENILFRGTTGEVEKSRVSLLAEWTRKEITHGAAVSTKTPQNPPMIPFLCSCLSIVDIVELEKEINKSFKAFMNLNGSEDALNALYQKQFAIRRKYGVGPLWNEIREEVLRKLLIANSPSWDMTKKLHFLILQAFELCHHQAACDYLKNKTFLMQPTPWFNTYLIAVPKLIAIDTVKKCLDLVASHGDYAYVYLAE
jgi:hypothetical protein